MAFLLSFALLEARSLSLQKTAQKPRVLRRYGPWTIISNVFFVGSSQICRAADICRVLFRGLTMQEEAKGTHIKSGSLPCLLL